LGHECYYALDYVDVQCDKVLCAIADSWKKITDKYPSLMSLVPDAETVRQVIVSLSVFGTAAMIVNENFGNGQIK
jgi:hypothetical protein